MDVRTERRGRSRTLIVAASMLAVVSWNSAALGDGPGSERKSWNRIGRAHPPPVVLDIDALGLLESWSARALHGQGRSSAQVIGARRSLLFSCRRTWSLYLTVEEADGAGGQPDHVASFGCAPGEALFAVADGVQCRRWPGGATIRRQSAASAPSVILYEGGGRTEALIAECVGPRGGIEPASIGADLGPIRPGSPTDCERPRSTVIFRSQVTAGGC